MKRDEESTRARLDVCMYACMCVLCVCMCVLCLYMRMLCVCMCVRVCTCVLRVYMRVLCVCMRVHIICECGWHVGVPFVNVAV